MWQQNYIYSVLASTRSVSANENCDCGTQENVAVKTEAAFKLVLFLAYGAKAFE